MIYLRSFAIWLYIGRNQVVRPCVTGALQSNIDWQVLWSTDNMDSSLMCTVMRTVFDGCAQLGNKVYLITVSHCRRLHAVDSKQLHTSSDGWRCIISYNSATYATHGCNVAFLFHRQGTFIFLQRCSLSHFTDLNNKKMQNGQIGGLQRNSVNDSFEFMTIFLLNGIQTDVRTIVRGRWKCGTGKRRTNNGHNKGPKMHYWKVQDLETNNKDHIYIHAYQISLLNQS